MSVDKCANCYRDFEKKKSGYKRYSLQNVLTGTNIVAREAISSITGVTFESVPARYGFFLCLSCWQALSAAVRCKEYLNTFCANTEPTSYIGLRAATQDSDWSVCLNQPSTGTLQGSENQQVIEHNYIKGKKNNQQGKLPLKTPPILVGQRKGGHKWDKVVAQIKNCEYAKAYRNLFLGTKASRQHFMKFVCKRVRKEVQCLSTSKSFPLFSEATASNLRNFSWDTTIDKLAECAPVLHSALIGAITRKKNENTLSKKGHVNLKVRLGTALSCLLYSKYPKKAGFIPSVYSAQIMKIRKKDAMKYLYRAGLCTNFSGASAVLNKIGNDFDTAAKTVLENGNVNEEEEEEDEDDTDDNDDNDEEEETGSDDNGRSKEDAEDEDNDVSGGEEVGLDDKEEKLTMVENGHLN